MLGEEKIVELVNVEIYEFCALNIETGEREFIEKKASCFSGLYFRSENIFFALYPTCKGPVIFYQGKEYALSKNLHISLIKEGKIRRFYIEEYNICIVYPTSKYLGFDVWSEEEDVDLFYKIEQSYKKDEFYRKFTVQKS